MPRSTTEREDSAQRLLNLLFALSSACAPLSTEEIVSDSDIGYGSEHRASDERKFRRDRDELARHGVIIAEVRPEGTPENEEARWALDRARTFAAGGIITADDADVLVHAIDDYLSVPGMPLRRPLAGVCRKLVRACSDASRAGSDGAGDATSGHPANEADGKGGKEAEQMVDTVWSALMLRHKLPIAYRDAAGGETRRTVAVYGLFSHDGNTYFTGLDDLTDSVRTFRVDRVERAWRPRGAYRIPEDFDVHEWLFLPFDFSDDSPILARFSLPDSTPRDEAIAIGHGRGTLSHDGDGRWHWQVEVRDVAAAAAFALAHARSGMRPEEPPELVETWTSMIEQVVSAHEDR